jgi:hypothetical protein
MDIDAEPANDEHPEANGEEVEAATSKRAKNKERSSGPVIIQSAAVLEAVKARPGNVEVSLHPEIFGNPAVAASYGFVRSRNGTWYVRPGCRR